MKLKIPENFNEITINEDVVKYWINRSKNAQFDADYYKYLFIGYFLFGWKIKFNKNLDKEYLREVKRFFYFWLNCYTLSLEEKSNLCSYILSFVVLPGKINKRIFNKIKGIVDDN